MRRNLIVPAFIIIICSGYSFLSRNNETNLDERSSIMIALGRYPDLSDKSGNPISLEEYRAGLEFKKYSATGADYKNVFHALMRDNSNGYIYYFFLSLLLKAVGFSLFWLRAFTILTAGINLYLIFVLAGQFQKKRIFQWTTLIMTAFNPVFYEDAILIRSYMLALLGLLLTINFLLKLVSEEGTSRSSFIFYFLSVLLAAGSHYFTISILLAETVIIAWKFLRSSFQWRSFLAGYLFLALVAISWFFLMQPVGWHSLFFIHNSIMQMSKGSDYIFSFKNLIRQWMNASTYFVGFSTQNLGKVRIILKFISAGILFVVTVRIWTMRRSEIKELLLMLIFFSSAFFSLQSFLTGNVTNFIPHYLIFLIPLFILGINTVISELADNNDIRKMSIN